jgi:hypothetical protein
VYTEETLTGFRLQSEKGVSTCLRALAKSFLGSGHYGPSEAGLWELQFYREAKDASADLMEDPLVEAVFDELDEVDKEEFEQIAKARKAKKLKRCIADISGGTVDDSEEEEDTHHRFRTRRPKARAKAGAPAPPGAAPPGAGAPAPGAGAPAPGAGAPAPGAVPKRKGRPKGSGKGKAQGAAPPPAAGDPDAPRAKARGRAKPKAKASARADEAAVAPEVADRAARNRCGNIQAEQLEWTNISCPSCEKLLCRKKFYSFQGLRDENKYVFQCDS